MRRNGFWDASSMYSVPAAAVGFRSSALMMRLTRSSMLEVLRQDYIRTARSKGASENVVNYYHALKNAMLPVVTVIGIEAAFLLGGLIVTETVFNIPGRGALPRRGGPLARLSDGAEPGDVHRDRRRRRSISSSTCCTRRSIRGSNTRVRRVTEMSGLFGRPALYGNLGPGFARTMLPKHPATRA